MKRSIMEDLKGQKHRKKGNCVEVANGGVLLGKESGGAWSVQLVVCATLLPAFDATLTAKW